MGFHPDESVQSVSRAVKSQSTQRAASEPPNATKSRLPADTDLPVSWVVSLFSLIFLQGANYTVILPTIAEYARSLGGSYWTAGAIIALQIGPYLVTSMLSMRLMRHRYIPLIVFTTLMAFVGNIMYGLGEITSSIEMLLASRLVQGFIGMPAVYHIGLDSVQQCSHRKFRTKHVSRMNNVSFLGMGLGPVFAAGLSKMDFSIGALEVNAFTSPGWVFGILYVFVLSTFVFVGEPLLSMNRRK